LSPASKHDFRFKDYAPWVFRHLRSLFHLDPADYLVSLTSRILLSELGSPGKSGSFFYFSRDYRFVIKTLHHAEHKYLRKILRLYFEVSFFNFSPGWWKARESESEYSDLTILWTTSCQKSRSKSISGRHQQCLSSVKRYSPNIRPEGFPLCGL